METSTIVIVSILSFIVTVIISGAIRHFRAKSDRNYDSPYFWDCIVHPGDALKEFEPIKSHYEEYEKAKDTEYSLKIAILRNLIDNGYPYADPRQSIRRSSKLPNLIELQNVIKLKPIIKEIEDQYKRFEEARDKADKEHELTGNLILKVMRKLKMDTEMQNLVSSRDVYNSKQPNRELYYLLSSAEAKEIVERCIAEVLKGES